MSDDAVIGGSSICAINDGLNRIERFWSEQIRYIY